MTGFQNGSTTGNVLWFNRTKRFGKAQTPVGEVFIPPAAASGWEKSLVPGAEVELTYLTGRQGLAASEISNVRVPLVELEGQVKFFDENKGFGYIETPEGDVRMRTETVGVYVDRLFEKAKVRLTATPSGRGFELDSIQWIEEIELPEGFFVCKVQMAKGKHFGFVKTPAGVSVYIAESVVTNAGAAMWDGMELEAKAKMSSRGPQVVAVRPVGSSDEPEAAIEAQADAEVVDEITEVPVEADAKPKAKAEKPKRMRAKRMTRAQKEAEAAKAAEAEASTGDSQLAEGLATLKAEMEATAET